MLAYIDNSIVLHPEDISGLNGLGVYGHDNLKDLSEAITKFFLELRNFNEPITLEVGMQVKIKDIEEDYGENAGKLN